MTNTLRNLYSEKAIPRVACGHSNIEHNCQIGRKHVVYYRYEKKKKTTTNKFKW